MMNAARAATRRLLPDSPFKPPPPAPPAEQFAVRDQVTHDKYGLGRVTSVEDDALVIDFGTRRVRVTMPCAKLTRLLRRRAGIPWLVIGPAKAASARICAATASSSPMIATSPGPAAPSLSGIAR